MIKRLVLAFALLAVTFPAFAASDCMSGMCGTWASKDNGNFVVTGSTLNWNHHEFQRCGVVAQDPRISIVKCTKVHNEGSDKIHDVTVYFYLREVNHWTMQVIYANHMPDGCVADTGCWPSSGMFFHRMDDDDKAIAPSTPAAPSAPATDK